MAGKNRTTRAPKASKTHPKRLHVVGIAGVTMAPLAVLYKEMGWQVTGSDRAFFPPMSTYLEQNGITIMPGFKEEHLHPTPDLALVMAFITKNNPELRFLIKHKIPYKAYAEVLPELIEGKNSVVIAGSRGKTSTTALLTWVLEKAHLNPNFMIGGIALNFPDGIRKTSSSWSVLEGDEYPVSNWKKKAKFLEYHPKYCILTGITWDHMDIYPTKKLYIETFQKLARSVPKEGYIIANAKGENIQAVLKGAKAKIVWYNNGEPFPLVPPFKGRAWEENSRAIAALAHTVGISDAVIQSAFRSFKGIKRRQEVRYKKSGLFIIDDNAHSPEKVEGVLETLQEQYPGYKIAAVYEPGSRNTAALRQKGYNTCFKKADYIILPKVSAALQSVAAFNEKLYQRISTHYDTLEYIPNDAALVLRLKKIAAQWQRSKTPGLIVFMSQKGFRNMIEETIKEIK